MAVTNSIIISVVINVVLTGSVVGLSVWYLKPDALTVNHQNRGQSSSDFMQYLDGWPIPFETGLIVKKYGYEVEAFDIYENKTVPLVNKVFYGYDIYPNKTVYYSSKPDDCFISSLSKNYPKLTQPSYLWFCPTVSSLAINLWTKVVYAYDENANKIDLFDMQGKHHGIVLSDISSVKDIVVDYLTQGRKIFILRLSPITGEGQILSAYADGSWLEEFVRGINMTAITISQDNTNLYWSENNTSIMTSLTYTKKIEKVITVPVTISSIAVLGKTLYFTSDDSHSEIYRCFLSRGNCDNYESISYDKPHNLKAFDLTIPFNSKSYLCEENNGACEHFCLPTNPVENDRNYRCACNIGWELTSDLRTCSRVNEYILYIRDFFVRGRILDMTKETFVDAIVPRRVEINGLVRKKAVDIDINAHKGYLIFSDDYRMYMVDLFGWNKQRLLGYDLQYSLYPAIDWVTDNIFYLRANNYKNSSYLMVRRLDDRTNDLDRQKTIYTFKKEERPQAIALDPYIGYVFVTVLDKTQGNARIYRMNSDGSDLQSFPKGIEKVSISEVALGMNHLEHKIYWFNKEKTMIQYKLLVDSSDLKSIDVSFAKDPVSINIHRQWIYISNRFDVWRIHKQTGESVSKILPTNERGMFSAAKGYSPNLQPIREDHPCTIDNGGCEQYCFANPDLPNKSLKRVCACNDSRKLQPDGKTCISPIVREPEN